MTRVERFVRQSVCCILLLLMVNVSIGANGSEELTMKDFERFGLPFYEGNHVKLLITGKQKFDDMFDVICQAKSYVYMDYYKFQQDSICLELFDILQQKASEGVRIRILYDSFGNRLSDKPLRKSYLKTLRAHGIEIEEFDRVRFPWVHHLFHRDHHKITIVDGIYVYSGGMNVADYYLYGKRGIGEWRDMHMRLEGPVVQGYESIFAEMWQGVTGEKIAVSPYRGGSTGPGKSLIALANRIPRISPDMMRKTFCAAIDNAHSLIQIVNPYPTLGGPVRASLYRALERGVRIQILVSTKSDGMANMDVVGVEMKKMMERGADVFYYEGGFHHGKYMMIDSLFCTVGTTNLDARSLRFDYEVNSFIFDRSVTMELQELFAKDVAQHCTLLTPEEWKRRFPFFRRLRSGMYMMVKGLL